MHFFNLGWLCNMLWLNYVAMTAKKSPILVDNFAYVDTLTMKHSTPILLRYRRTDGEMPCKLNVHLSSRNYSIYLHMRCNSRINNDIPVYVVDDDQELKKVRFPHNDKIAVYSDVKHGASFVVEQVPTVMSHHDYHLHGSLYLNGNAYILTPKLGHTKELSNENRKHVLGIADQNHQYDLDYVVPEKENTDNQSALHKKWIKRSTLALQNHSNNGRKKSFIIKVNLVCDYACFKRFLDRSHSNHTMALKDAKLYFMYQAQSLNTRYQTITDVVPNVKISVDPLSVNVAMTARGASYSEKSLVPNIADSVDGNKLLKLFRHWVRNRNLPKASTTILLTGFNMMTNGDAKKSGQIGLGYKGGACSDNGVVVVEEKFHAITGMTAAHELGHSSNNGSLVYCAHSLNSKHDVAYSMADATCIGDDARYVMSSYIGVPPGSSKPWKFSPCSAKAIVRFLTSMKRESCFHDDGKVSVNAVDAGQEFDADDQCVLVFGEQSYFCRTEQLKSRDGFDGLCTRMYCWNDSRRQCFPVIAQEHTSCGNKKA